MFARSSAVSRSTKSSRPRASTSGTSSASTASSRRARRSSTGRSPRGDRGLHQRGDLRARGQRLRDSSLTWLPETRGDIRGGGRRRRRRRPRPAERGTSGRSRPRYPAERTNRSTPVPASSRRRRRTTTPRGSPRFSGPYEGDAAAGELRVDRNPDSVVVVGGGPIRIGQGVEFDYCSVHAVRALREQGIEAHVVNNNPETVSTDYDTSDGLFFEPITAEEVADVVEATGADGVMIQFGGQTSVDIGEPLAAELDRRGVDCDIMGTSVDAMDLAEDRDRFNRLMDERGIAQPEGAAPRARRRRSSSPATSATRCSSARATCSADARCKSSQTTRSSNATSRRPSASPRQADSRRRVPRGRRGARRRRRERRRGRRHRWNHGAH